MKKKRTGYIASADVSGLPGQLSPNTIRHYTISVVPFDVIVSYKMLEGCTARHKVAIEQFRESNSSCWYIVIFQSSSAILSWIFCPFGSVYREKIFRTANSVLNRPSRELDAKMTLAAVFFLTLLASAIALPVKPDSKLGPLIKLPVFVEESTNDESSPVLYALILSKLDEPENSVGEKLIEKRETNEDDLETAAGNFAFRPLFVYRQQLAYKQRGRNVYGRRGGF